MGPTRVEHQGQWFVSFFFNWDTDALGLPGSLNVIVDATTGNVGPSSKHTCVDGIAVNPPDFTAYYFYVSREVFNRNSSNL
jgi:hypothetical protein